MGSATAQGGRGPSIGRRQFVRHSRTIPDTSHQRRELAEPGRIVASAIQIVAGALDP